jgi:lysozyme family protein
MSHFDKAILSVLLHEGGYCDNKADPGGETNFGICKRNYPRLDIKALTKESAINIYRADYWRKEYDQLSYPVAAKVFDMAVNMGQAQAIKILQRAVGTFDDGVIGPKTIAKTNDLPVELVLNNITAEQKKVYARIIEKRPTSAVFMAGWNKRAEWHPTVA